MKIFARGSKRPANPLEELLNLFTDGSVACGDHFRDEQTGKDAVFFRNVAANGEAGAFFAAESDFIVSNELADVLKAHGRLENGLSVGFCRGVEEFRCRHASSCGQFPFTRFDEIIVYESEDQIGLDPRTVRVDNAEAVGVSAST